MKSDRSALIWGLVAGQAARRRGRVSAVDVCAAAVAALPVSGAWVLAQAAAAAGHLMGVTDAVSEQLAELQMTLGEGPFLDVMASGTLVLVSDLDEVDAVRRWPGFTPQARQIKAAAIVALPLRIGAIQVGSLGLYRDTPGPLSTAQLGDALIFADTATMVLLESQHLDGAAEAAVPGRAASRRIWPGTGPRSTRPPGWSRPSSTWPSARPLSGCGPTPMLRIGGSATSPATSSPAACG